MVPPQLHPRIDASDQAANLGVLLIGDHYHCQIEAFNLINIKVNTLKEMEMLMKNMRRR